MTRQNERTCPPCNGECAQGRRCPAMDEGDSDPSIVDTATFWTAVVVGLSLLGALVVVAIRSCTT